MLQKFNPFFGDLMVSNKARRAGRPTKGGRKRYAGQAAVAQEALNKNNGVDSYHTNAGAANLINIGRRSHHNVETPLHQNAVSLKIKNNDQANRADLVLAAGFRAEEAGIAAQLIADGKNQDITNDDNQVVNVDVECEFGVHGTNTGWQRFLKYVDRDGLLVTSTRMEWTTKEQKRYKLKFDKDDMFDDNVIDHIFPEVYYNPSNFDQNIVQTDLEYLLTDKSVVKYSVLPATTVIFTFWIGGRLDVERFLQNYMRRNGGNSLL